MFVRILLMDLAQQRIYALIHDTKLQQLKKNLRTATDDTEVLKALIGQVVKALKEKKWNSLKWKQKYILYIRKSKKYPKTTTAHQGRQRRLSNKQKMKHGALQIATLANKLQVKLLW